MKKYLESNKHYSHLIESIGAWGLYQRQLLAVIVIGWFVAGMYETALFVFFDMGDPACQAISKAECIDENHMCKDINRVKDYFPGGELPVTLPYLLEIECSKGARYWLESVDDIAPVLGALLAGWLSVHYGKKKLLIVGNILLMLGTFILLFKRDSLAGVIIGQIFIGVPHYALCIVLLSLMPDVTTEKITAWAVVAAMIGSKIGRMLMAGIFMATNNLLVLICSTLLPVVILYLFVHCYYYESPRYLIDTDLFQAFEVLRKIALKNNSSVDEIDIENSFLISKFTVKSYSYWTIFKYRSLRVQTYAYCWIMCMVGLLSQYPSLVLETRLSRGYQELAMGAFELISLIPCFLFIDIYRRKVMCITISSVLFLLCLALPFIGKDPGLPFMIRVALLGLACVTLSVLTVFVTASVMETYPHTVRTLAICLFFACFLLGRSLESIAEYLLSEPLVLAEMFAEGAFVLLFHTIAIRETKQSIFTYEVQELIEEAEEETLLE